MAERYSRAWIWRLPDDLNDWMGIPVRPEDGKDQKGEKRPRKWGLFDTLLLSGVVISLCATAYFAIETRNRFPRRVAVSQTAAPPREGQILPAIPCSNRSGEASVVGQPSRPTLVYVFSEQCFWCVQNWNSADRLISSLLPSHDIVLVASSAPGTAKSPRAPYLCIADSSVLKAMGLTRTPMTLELSPERIVRRVWTGAYGERNSIDIEKHFRVPLRGPGM